MARKVLACIGDHLSIPDGIVDYKDGERFTLIVCDTESDLLSDGITAGDFAIVKDPLGFYVGTSSGYQPLNLIPVGGMTITEDDEDPATIYVYGQWEEVKKWSGLKIWKRTA